ncbi:LOW QUALITY PROTEIN: heterogeneous nuclear ribonucleoprotein 1-like [Phalaenopsis equestris]|uniref:LOW QUALITY PROTEIN: heterogeneous nuclear ribonucleoprotein 1-like n=1 Tax=Phalaenopsis equestris TaxID=78828 RepID=UPI0009E5D2AF|nr:LOW QUALITY PROTEIN: heterogeneous nuclear ribonucleoprotein 1-like [Phalaenopsis equestris]
MDSDQGKLFIGGISWETTEEKLKDYFSQYGDVLQTVVMRDKATGKPRGFGFVAFADPSIVDRVLQDTHTIDGRTVEAKKAMSREEQHTAVRSGNNTMRNAGGGGGGGRIRNKKIFVGGAPHPLKIFVGGLPPTLSDMEFRKYFEAFGTVTDVVVMYDPNTQRPRGFGFISFDSEDSVDRVVQKQFHDVGGKAVEVKRALPKDANPGNTTNRSVGGGTYQSYGSSGTNSNSYDNRVDGSRYMQAPASGAGYNPYGSSGYGAPAYGYGTATNGVGFSYGNTGAYGNPGGLGAGYVSGPPGAPRSGYVSTGYGANAGYGGAVSGHTGQSPSAAAGYGNQGFGYSGYGGPEGPYGNPGGYGGVNPSGGGEQGLGGGFASGGYNDGSGSTGYSNAWRSDPAQGGGYGAGQLAGAGAPGGAIGYSGYTGSQSRGCCVHIVAMYPDTQWKPKSVAMTNDCWTRCWRRMVVVKGASPFNRTSSPPDKNRHNPSLYNKISSLDCILSSFIDDMFVQFLIF